MSDETKAPSCEKCGTLGVPSYLVLSPRLQYWRCPDCFRIWTTLKTTFEQYHETHASPASSASARSQCPECSAGDVVDLSDILSSENVDYFRCGTCNCWWMVPKGKNGPPIRAIFGDPNAAALRKDDKAG
jgi:hypothetical protein